MSFLLATSVFRDPMAITIYDDEHSEEEERWVSMGQAQNGQYIVVIHTSEWLDDNHIKVRIISARKAEQHEIHDYEDLPPRR